MDVLRTVITTSAPTPAAVTLDIDLLVMKELVMVRYIAMPLCNY